MGKKATVLGHALDDKRAAVIRLDCGHDMPSDRPRGIGSEVECDKNHSGNRSARATTSTPRQPMQATTEAATEAAEEDGA